MSTNYSVQDNVISVDNINISNKTMDLLKQSFQPYFEKYPKTELDWTIDYPDFENKFMMISIIPNSKLFNKHLTSKCLVSFIKHLIDTNLYKSDNKSWVFEISNEDLPHSIDYSIYVR